MTAVLNPAPKEQFFTAAGIPLVGGLLYTYASGTLTPAVTYVDQAGVTQNPNPIVLDTRGECNLWLTPGAAYKFRLEDSLGNEQWTVDDVIAIGTMGSQNASAVAITGGTIEGVSISADIVGNATNVTGIVAIANGGTGQVTAPAAIAALGAAARGANTDITSVAATTTINGNVIGYRDIPANQQTGAYVPTLTDRGETISITTGGVAIPAFSTVAFPIGSAFSVYNNSATPQTISITSDTLRFAGTLGTGPRTLAGYGLCTVYKPAVNTEWVVSGAGIT